MGLNEVDDLEWITGLHKLEDMVRPPVKGNPEIIHGYIDRLIKTVPGEGPEYYLYALTDVLEVSGFQIHSRHVGLITPSEDWPEEVRGVFS